MRAVVDGNEMVRGYEFQKGSFVTFTADEYKALGVESDATIAITEFLDDAMPLVTHIDRSYFLGPDKGGDRAYRLLVAALLETGRAAIARYAVRGKMHLVLLAPSEQRLLMVQLHYADEVRSIKDVPLEPTELDEDELELAKLLTGKLRASRKRRGVANLTGYRDEVKDRVRAQIDRKIAGQEIVAAPRTDGAAPILDLEQALKASLLDARPPRRGRRAAPAREAR
jgi:DNA end-binding protein Ku